MFGESVGRAKHKKKVDRVMTGKRINVFSERAVHHIGSKLSGSKLEDIDVVATIRAAVPHQKARRGNRRGYLSILREDVRKKIRKKKISFATVIVIDSSGSINQKEMERLKATACSWIEDSYQKRDNVGLVAFRNHQAHSLMPLCPRSHFKKALECIGDLPSGGGTPLAAGLLEAMRLLFYAPKRYAGFAPVIILLSDGRANVPTHNAIDIDSEIRMICQKIRSLGILLVFVDTESEAVNCDSGKYGPVRDVLKALSWSHYSMSDISHAAG